MASVNKVILVGHLGKDPESRTIPNGNTVTNFSIATSEKWTDKETGEKKEKTEWHNIVCWGRVGEIAAKYLNKGSLVYVDGKLETQKYEDQDGITKYTTKVNVFQLQMLSSNGGKSDEDESGEQEPDQVQQQHQPVAAIKAAAGVNKAGKGGDLPF
jgi:single-strand DNA-binding protein